MRGVVRVPLDAVTEENLNQRQAVVDRKRQEGTLQVNGEWKNARQTQSVRTVLAALKRMMGERERCMYCLDSHGTDIEHF